MVDDITLLFLATVAFVGIIAIDDIVLGREDYGFIAIGGLLLLACWLASGVLF